MRIEHLHESDVSLSGVDLWSNIASGSWQPNSSDSTAIGKPALQGKKSVVEPNDRMLTIPMDIYGAGAKDAGACVMRGDGWVLPIGANSDDKKKDVPLEAIDKPDSKLPDAWQHPASSWMDGKCGITGVSNMLRFYNMEKPPADIDCSKYRSYGPGLRVDKFASNLRELSGKNFSSCNIDDGREPLDVLRKYIKEGKPVAIQYMTGPTNAHWVVVTNVSDGKDGPQLEVQSWGAYHKVKWHDIQDQWRRGYGGPFPHVVADESSPHMKKAK